MKGRKNVRPKCRKFFLQNGVVYEQTFYVSYTLVTLQWGNGGTTYARRCIHTTKTQPTRRKDVIRRFLVGKKRHN